MAKNKKSIILTVELDYPVERNGKTVSSISFGLPTVKQLMYVETVKETKSEAEAGLLAMIASTALAGDEWTMEEIEGLYAPDFAKIGDEFVNFTQGLETK